MSIFDKDISDSLLVKDIKTFIYNLDFALSVSYISKPFDEISSKIFNLDFNEFISIYEINWEEIKFITGNGLSEQTEKEMIIFMINKNYYNFYYLLEYTFNVLDYLQWIECEKYELIINNNSSKSKAFSEIKNLIEKIIKKKNMEFIIYNEINWKLVDSNVNQLLKNNKLLNKIDPHYDWKEIINDYFALKNKSNISKKHTLHKLIANSVESKKDEIKNSSDTLKKEIFKFLNNNDIRHINNVNLTEQELDYQMKLILLAFTVIDL